MIQNPYKPPGDSRSQSEISKQLRENEKEVGGLRPSIRFSLVSQLFSMIAASMMLDGGRFFRSVIIATLLFWCLSGTLVMLRRNNLSRASLLFVKWGFFGFLFAVILQMLE